MTKALCLIATATLLAACSPAESGGGVVDEQVVSA